MEADVWKWNPTKHTLATLQSLNDLHTFEQLYQNILDYLSSTKHDWWYFDSFNICLTPGNMFSWKHIILNGLFIECHSMNVKQFFFKRDKLFWTHYSSNLISHFQTRNWSHLQRFGSSRSHLQTLKQPPLNFISMSCGKNTLNNIKESTLSNNLLGTYLGKYLTSKELSIFVLWVEPNIKISTPNFKLGTYCI